MIHDFVDSFDPVIQSWYDQFTYLAIVLFSTNFNTAEQHNMAWLNEEQ